jgi:hypothetical protein
VKPGWLRGFANALLALCAVDALLSLCDEALRAALGVQWLALPRSALAELAFSGLASTVPVMLATPRLPVPVFVPLTIATFWLTLGAAPLPLWIASAPLLSVTGCLIQLVAVALAFTVVRTLNGGRGWWFTESGPERPAFAWRHSLAFGAALCSLGPLAAIGYGAVALATWAQIVTHGFIHFGLEGVSLADRHYRRDGQEIRLVGMMHIGDPEAYRSLTRSFARESTVVLEEGVSDREERLASALHYGRAARALGLAAQEDLSAYLVDGKAALPETLPWPIVRHADVDASAFSAETIACIRWASQVWEAEDLASALREILRGAQERGPEQLAAFQAEVLGLRNEHLVKEIQRALGEYEHVVVPWGALHLPEIEKAVLSMGFSETSREQHPLFAWRTVVAALF